MAKPQSQSQALLQPPDMDDEIEEREEIIASELKRELREDFLNKYTSKYAFNEKPDTLDNRYTILPNQPLPQFDNNTAKAFMAIDEMNSERKLYAIVCATYLPTRQKVAAILKDNQSPHNISILAEGIVKLSTLNEQRYVVIFDQPKGKLLSEIIAAQTHAFSDRYLIEKIIEPLVAAISVFEENGITHGRINPNNIYVGTSLTLGECVSEPYGYSQDFHFEPIYQMQASRAGKGNGHISNDYYALGVIVALMKVRPKSLQDPDQERFLRRLLREGSFLGIVGYADASDEINDLLRGTLNDVIADRWTFKQLKPWTTGKRFNLLIPTIPNLGTRTFELNGVEYNNLRYLSHIIHRVWEQALSPIRDGSLAKWVEQSTRRREISEYLTRTIEAYATSSGKAIHEMLTRFIFALDSQAPIRSKTFAAHVDGIGTLFAELYHQKNDVAMQQLGDLIEQSITSSWADTQRRIFHMEKPQDDIKQIISSIDKTRPYMRTQGLGYGPERVLYEINPSLPCQSPIVKGYYASNLKELLVALDNIAGQKNKPEYPIDRHVAAFIAAKANISKDMSFTEFSAYPALVKDKGLISLKFLALAQGMANEISLPGLTVWCTESFLDAIGTLHSKTIRTQVCNGLQILAYRGKLPEIVEFLTNFNYAEADARGFIAATDQYGAYTNKIRDLKSNELRTYKAYILGSTIAKFIAYTILFLVITIFFYGE